MVPEALTVTRLITGSIISIPSSHDIFFLVQFIERKHCILEYMTSMAIILAFGPIGHLEVCPNRPAFFMPSGVTVFGVTKEHALN